METYEMPAMTQVVTRGSANPIAERPKQQELFAECVLATTLFDAESYFVFSPLMKLFLQHFIDGERRRRPAVETNGF
jgi:hypothetical protein